MRRKAPLSCDAAFSMSQCSLSFVAAQLLITTTSALQKSGCCSATSAAQLSENCSATSVFACGMLQGWGLEGWGLVFAEKMSRRHSKISKHFFTAQNSHAPRKFTTRVWRSVTLTFCWDDVAPFLFPQSCDPVGPHRTPQTPKQLKSQKSDSKVAFRGHPRVAPKVTQKWRKLPKTDSKITEK